MHLRPQLVIDNLEVTIVNYQTKGCIEQWKVYLKDSVGSKQDMAAKDLMAGDELQSKYWGWKGSYHSGLVASGIFGIFEQQIRINPNPELLNHVSVSF